jgi:hypothetical protein
MTFDYAVSELRASIVFPQIVQVRQAAPSIKRQSIERSPEGGLSIEQTYDRIPISQQHALPDKCAQAAKMDVKAARAEC